MREKSIWGYHEGLSFSRRFIAHFAGFLVLFFLCTLCFHVVDPLMCRGNTAIGRATNRVRETQTVLTNILLDTHLTYRSEHELADAATVGTEYVRALCPDAADMGEVVSKAGDPTNGTDALFYYYTVYKPAHQEDYPADSSSGMGAARAALLTDQVRDYFEGETYPRLRAEYAGAVRAWLAEGSKDTSGINGETVANEITVAYADAIRAAKEDVAASYHIYRNTETAFVGERNILIGYKWAELTVIYTAVMMIAFLLIPLLTKRRVSPLYLLLRTAAVTPEGDVVTKRSVIIGFFVRFVAFFNLLYLAPVLLWGRNSIVFFRYRLFGFLPMTVLWGLSLVVLIVSLILSGTDKMTHRTLADRASHQVYKDIR